MFVHDLMQGLLRRWYFVLACLLATLSVAAYFYVTTPPTYEANASVVLVPPIAQVEEGSNPFLYMGGLEQALAVLTVRVDSPAVADPILGKNPELTYTVARDTGTAGPIVRITAEGNTAESTLRILNDVVKAMPESMKYLQDELQVAEKVRITVMTIVQDNEAKAVTKKLQRLVLSILGAGILLTILATSLLDRALNARKSRQGKSSDEQDEEDVQDIQTDNSVTRRNPAGTGLAAAPLVLPVKEEKEPAAQPVPFERHNIALTNSSYKD